MFKKTSSISGNQSKKNVSKKMITWHFKKNPNLSQHLTLNYVLLCVIPRDLELTNSQKRKARHLAPQPVPRPPQSAMAPSISSLPIRLRRSLLPQPYVLEVSNRVQVEEAEAAARRATAAGGSGAAAGYEGVHGVGGRRTSPPPALLATARERRGCRHRPRIGRRPLLARHHARGVVVVSAVRR